MNDTELVGTAQGIIKRVKVITGWPIPELEEDRRILYAELSKYLREAWPMLNAEEIMFAIRSHAISAKNWGKDINLSLLSAAIAEYYTARVEASEIEARKAAVAFPTLPAGPADWKEECEYRYQQFLNGRIHLEMWPHELYDEFVRSGMMAADVYENFLNDATSALLSTLHTELQDARLARNDKLAEEVHTRIDAVIAQDAQQCTFLAKKLAVRYLYAEAEKRGLKCLFIKE